MKPLIIYWLVASIPVGFALNYHVDKCPQDPLPSETNIVLQVLILPAVAVLAILHGKPNFEAQCINPPPTPFTPHPS